MNTDQRDLLDVLKSELAFLEKGGYGRSPREPQRPQLIFEDSPTCMNYDTKEHPDPCSECILMQLVPPESRGAEIPCRHIPFNAEGETLESLYRYAGQYETEQIYGKWLRATIARLEDEREAHREIPASPAATGVCSTVVSCGWLASWTPSGSAGPTGWSGPAVLPGSHPPSPRDWPSTRILPGCS